MLGIATGVAAVAGIDLASASAERAFSLSVDSVAGAASHEVISEPSGVDETLYSQLVRLPHMPRLAPVVEGWIELENVPRPVRVLGIDALGGLGTGRASLAGTELSGTGLVAANPDGGGLDLSSLLVRPGAALFGARLFDELGTATSARDEEGNRRETGAPPRIDLVAPVGLATLVPIGVLRPSDARQADAIGRMVVVDISTAQELLGRLGRIDRIDIDLGAATDSPAARAAIQRVGEALPAGTILQAKASRAGALEEMTYAFRLNLRALSMLALLVGAFLIYSTVSFAVVQRRQLIGLARALGTSRRQIAGLVLGEALIIGTLGTALGLVAGTVLARGLLGLMVQTINDLYFALEVERVAWLGAPIVVSAVLGLATSLLAASVPAWEAANAPPRQAQLRSQPESRSQRRAPWIAVGGLALLALAGLWVVLEPRGLFAGFAAVFLTVAGAACLVPALTAGAMLAVAPLLRRAFGSLGALAARGVVATLSRTGIALAALVVAVATATGVGVMVHSFRTTVIDWLDVTLQADVYVSTLRGGRGTRPSLPPAVVAAIRETPGVAHTTTYRRVEVGSPEGPVQVVVTEMAEPAFGIFRLVDTLPGGGSESGDARARVYRALHERDAAMISTPLAYRLERSAGDTITLVTAQGPRPFTIAAVYDDFASDRGTIHLMRNRYDRYFDDPAIDSLGLFASTGTRAESLQEALETRLEAVDEGSWVEVIPNRAIRALSLEIFDRTFRVTQVLRLLAVAIAFVGVFASLMALELERGRERAILRALGLAPRQLRTLVTAQTALMGLCAGVLAAPLGVVLAWFLVHVINRRAFGWTLHMEVPPMLLVQGIVLAVLAALLAGWWPARRMARALPARALREE